MNQKPTLRENQKDAHKTIPFTIEEIESPMIVNTKSDSNAKRDTALPSRSGESKPKVAAERFDKRNSILMPSLQMLIDRKMRRGSLNPLSRNYPLQSSGLLSTKASSEQLENMKGLFRTQTNDSRDEPEISNKYRIVVSEPIQKPMNLNGSLGRLPLRRMNLKLHPATMTFKRISQKAQQRLEKERLAGMTKIEYLAPPACESILPDIRRFE